MRIQRWYLVAGLLGATALTVYAQGGRRFFGMNDTVESNATYDGRFIFARVRYRGNGCMSAEGPGWHHDYPTAERNLTRLLTEMTTVKSNLDSSVVVSLDDPELFKYPIAYLSEPGCWQTNEAEFMGLRKFLQKGGFLIFDDFGGGYNWSNLEFQMKQVLPEAQFIKLTLEMPVFQAFFAIESMDWVLPTYRGTPEFYGIFEDNDPSKRLMVVANYNNDIGESWEFSDQGFPELTNEQYKLGVNYLIYALTH